MSDVTEALPTLNRRLRGERLAPLPVRARDMRHRNYRLEFFPPRKQALEQALVMYPEIGTARTSLRLGNIRGRRDHTSPHACDWPTARAFSELVESGGIPKAWQI